MQDSAGPGLGSSVKWVKPENLHITYVFLGDTTRHEELPAIRKSLDEAAGASGKVPVTLGGLGAFPSLEYPRVLWLGFKDGRDALKAIAGRIHEGLTREGFVFEHGFSPHVTIARVNHPGRAPDRHEKRGEKFRPDRGAMAALAERADEPGPGDTVGSLDLMESRLSSRGPEYRVVYSKELL